MKQIKTLEQLEQAAIDKKAVTVKQSRVFARSPAAWVIHLPGIEILRLLRAGMYIYEPKQSKEA